MFKKVLAMLIATVLLLSQILPLTITYAEATSINYYKSIPWKSSEHKQSDNIRSIAFGNGRFVAVGDGGKILVSIDGSKWTPANSSTSESLVSVKWNGNKFVAVGDNQTMIESNNGIDWNIVCSIKYSGMFCDIAFHEDEFVVVGGGGIWHSSDQSVGTKRLFDQEAGLESIVWGKDKYVAIEGTGRIFSSKDGVKWENISRIEGGYVFNCINYLDGMYYAVSNKGNIFSSKDATKWNKVYHSNTNTAFYRVISGSNLLICVGVYGVVAMSTDGITWYETTLENCDDFNSIAYGNNTYVVAGFNFKSEKNSGTIWYANIGPDNDASIKSTIFKIDSKKCVISNVPQNISYSSFLKALVVPIGDKVEVFDKQNNKTQILTKDSVVEVVARDGITTRRYSIQLKDIAVYLNNKKINFTSGLILKDNVFLAPIKKIGESLDCIYSFDKKNNKISFTKGLNRISMTINSNIADVNGKRITMPTKAIYSSEIYIPLQFLCQKLGYKYTYDEVNGTININW